MCVIFVADKARPNDDMVEKAYDHNDHGAGVAWREDGFVRWEKGLTVEQMKEHCSKLPMPFVAHFRIASCGGRHEELCHPFPVTEDVQLNLEGKIKGYVLFHNGHWARWRDSTLEAALKADRKIPPGRWSDSRAMAWAAHRYGLGILEMIDEKTISFGHKDIEMSGSGWLRINEVLCSNGSWNTTFRRNDNYTCNHAGYMSSICQYQSCRKPKLVNSGFCLDHQPKLSVENKKPESGGTPVETFRNSSPAFQRGQTQSEKAEESTALVRRLSSGGEEEEIDILTWAKSINQPQRRRHNTMRLTV